VGRALLDLDGVKGSNGMEEAERALSIDPDLAEGLAAKARVLYTLGRFDEAEAAIFRALDLEPDSYDVHATAGRIYIAMKRWDDAIRHLLRVADIAENDFWALGMAGTCYQAKGDPAGEKVVARRCLDRVEKTIAQEPDHGNALGFGVGVLVRLGEKDRAMEWADRALLLDPENRNLRYNMACAMALAGEHSLALELLEVTFREANQQGYEWFKHDSDLDSLRRDPRFIRMLGDLGARLAAESARA
jgi:adenylate cyclase